MKDPLNEQSADFDDDPPSLGRRAARVCVPVCVKSAAQLPDAITRAARFADVVEIRFDCLEPAELVGALESLGPLLDAPPRPFIFTLRPASQGGAHDFADDERQRFWHQLASELRRRADAPRAAQSAGPVHFADLELDGGPSQETCAELARVCKIIRSHHDFDGHSEDLSNIYARASETEARVIKIAFNARDATDCLRVFRLLERARAEGRPLIAVAMGQAGVPTRVLAPSRGAFLTYAALDPESATAPGQLRAEDLRELYRVDSVDAATVITGVVGSPVAHSLSPRMHNRAFARERLNAVYLPFEVFDVGAFARRMARPRTRELEWNLRGFSVTAPHKTAMLTHLDWAEPRALEVGAVNTVVITDEGELRGYNTDAEAFVAPLRARLELRGARVAVLGAGGAARAAMSSLKAHGAVVGLFARNVERAAAVAADFGAEVAPLDGARFGDFEAVVNTTPLGTRGPHESETPATSAQLGGARIAYDLVYNPRMTRFMREARAAGCETIGGLPMLVAQAAAQFKLWTGRDAPQDVMRRAAEEGLS